MPATALPPATVTGPGRAGRVAKVLRADPIGKATMPSVPSTTQAASLSAKTLHWSAKTLPQVERALVQRWRHARTSRGAQRSAGEETPREHAQGMRMPIVCKRRLACRHGRYTVVVPSPFSVLSVLYTDCCFGFGSQCRAALLRAKRSDADSSQRAAAGAAHGLTMGAAGLPRYGTGMCHSTLNEGRQ